MSFRQIRKLPGMENIVKDLAEKLQRTQADKGVEDITLFRQNRVDYDAIAFADTDTEVLDGDKAVASSLAFTDSDDGKLCTKGTFKIAEGKNVVDVWLRYYKDLLDYSGNGLDAILAFGTEQYLTGKAQDAFNFDGLTGLTIADNAKLRVTPAFSFDFWYMPTSMAQDGAINQRIVNKWDDANNQYCIAIGSTGAFRARVERAGVTVNNSWTNQFAVGILKHYGVAYDGTNITLYVNGVAGSNGTGGDAANGTTTFKIGHQTSTTGRLNGILSPVRRYNYALSASEFLNLYNTGLLGGSIYDPPLAISFNDLG